MNSGYGTTAYFSSESDARRAAEDLRLQGCDVDVHTQGTHGQNFWDTIKNFFSGQTDYEQYGSGTIVKIDGGDPQSVQTIVQQYNGRLSGGDIAGSTTGTTTPSDTSVSAGTGMSSGTASSVSGTATTTGTTASETGGLVENETEYQRSRTGGVAGTGDTGMSSSTGDVPNLD